MTLSDHGLLPFPDATIYSRTFPVISILGGVMLLASNGGVLIQRTVSLFKVWAG